MDEALRLRARTVPRDPGVYLWKDAKGAILYVGKAQDLRARVTQYLGRAADEKTERLMEEAADLDFVAVNTEKEALILEQNLIKQHRPPFNVLLVDDKRYPYIAVTREAHPRVVYTRDLSRPGTFFGPFPEAGHAKRIARLLNRTFRLRQCRVLPKRECLYYHLGQCSAPCIGAVSTPDYQAQAQQATEFLQGHGADLSRRLRTDMEEAAESQRFERAAELRDLAQAIESVLERQHTESTRGGTHDALGVSLRDGRACVLVLFVRDGVVVGREAHMLQAPSGTPPSTVLEAFIEQYYATALGIPPTLVTRDPLPGADAIEAFLGARRGSRVRLRWPTRGALRAHAELAQKNAALALEQDFLIRERRGSGALEELQRLLGLSEVPELIEAFDVSHHAGQLTVASLVAMLEGKPAKSRYRRFRLREAQGGDDPGAMREVVHRRYRRLLDEEGAAELPNLILVDGGPTQVAAALESLTTLGLEAVPLVGLAKRLEELYRPHQLHPIRLPPDSPALHVLQQLRDEAHRFAISYQGLLKRKSVTASALDDVPGVGPQRRRKLLTAFGSVDGLRQASADELARVAGVPRDVADRIKKMLGESEAA